MKTTKKKRHIVKTLKEEIKKKKLTFAVYVILRLIVIAAIMLSMLRGRYENVFVCVFALVLFLVPAFFKKNLGIELPSALEVIIMLFIFCAIILGEIGCYYVKVPMWDTMLHTLNGFLCAAIGFSLVDILNRNNRFKFNLSPLYLSIVSFCFSMTIGVLWEMFEFGADIFLSTDMQKDFVINKISSVTLDATLSNTPVIIDKIEKVSVNGVELGLGGYLDIGLIDTMKDMIVNFLGAVVFSVIGYFYVKSRGKSGFAKNFIPVVENVNEKHNDK
ncbi:MAG: hypothetical protein J6K12_00885 [Clostridia bacterium]|nr:hypothetical protein [Clostridia bacterium]